MATESSVVSNLIRQSNTRSLDADAGDELLFRNPASERGASRPQPFQPLARWRPPTPIPVAEAPSIPVPAPAAPPRRTKRRARAWPFLAAMTLSTIVGAAGF